MELIKNLTATLLFFVVGCTSNPFWKDKPSLKIQLKKWNIDKIKNLLRQTYDLELKIKSNSFINHQVLIKKLMIDICAVANA